VRPTTLQATLHAWMGQLVDCKRLLSAAEECVAPADVTKVDMAMNARPMS
jgi:hypothetical protein